MGKLWLFQLLWGAAVVVVGGWGAAVVVVGTGAAVVVVGTGAAVVVVGTVNMIMTKILVSACDHLLWWLQAREWLRESWS